MRWRWALAASLALFPIGVGELYARVRFGEVLQIHVRPQIYQIDERLGYRYRPNAHSHICIPSICKEIWINAAGYHGPPFVREKPPGVYRIAIVGASTATGIWLQGERPFPTVIQQLLDQAGRRGEVLNFSVDGSYRGLANLRLIEDEVLDYSPELILMPLDIPLLAGSAMRENYRGYVYYPGVTGMTAAEVEANRAALRRHIDAIDETWLSTFYTASYLVRALHRKLALGGKQVRFPTRTWRSDLFAFQTKRVVNQFALVDVGTERSLDEIERVARLARRAGAKLVTFTDESSSHELQSQFADRKLPLMQLPFRHTKRYVHAHDGHLNLLGHEALGRLLFSRILAIMDQQGTRSLGVTIPAGTRSSSPE